MIKKEQGLRFLVVRFPTWGEVVLVTAVLAMPFFWSSGLLGGSSLLKGSQAHPPTPIPPPHRQVANTPLALNQLGVLPDDGLPLAEAPIQTREEESQEHLLRSNDVSARTHAHSLVLMQHAPRLRAPESIASGAYLPDSFRGIPAYVPPSVEVFRFGRK